MCFFLRRAVRFALSLFAIGPGQGFAGGRFDPFPMPDQMEEQAGRHDVAAVGMNGRNDSLERAPVSMSGKEVKVEDDAGEDTDQSAEEEQEIEIEILFHATPSFFDGGFSKDGKYRSG